MFLAEVQQTKKQMEKCNRIVAHPAKIDLDKKWLPKQKTIQNFNIDAQGFRKTRNENSPMREIGVTMLVDLPLVGKG